MPSSTPSPEGGSPALPSPPPAPRPARRSATTTATAAALMVVGPTAVGKSALALAVARLAGDVEIVTADSMQVYRGMDVGTAKPTVSERAEVPHHLIDLVDPHESFSVSDYQHAARAALTGIAARGRRPLVVGGTGLYVQALTDELELPGQYPAVRRELEVEADTAVLYRRLVAADPLAASRMEPTNRRRVVRALEVTLGAGRPFSSFGPGLGAYPPTVHRLVGVDLPRPELDRRIEERYHRQLADGFLDEIGRLDAAPGGLSVTAAQALGYKELLAHVRGECTLDEALRVAVARTRRFARRQQRWFRRDPRIRWLDPALVAAVSTEPMAVASAVLEDWSVT